MGKGRCFVEHRPFVLCELITTVFYWKFSYSELKEKCLFLLSS